MRRRSSVLLGALVAAGVGLSISAAPGWTAERTKTTNDIVMTTRQALTDQLTKSELGAEDRTAIESIYEGFLSNFTRMVLAGSGQMADFDLHFDRRIAPKLQGYGLDSDSIRPLLRAATEAAFLAANEPQATTAERER